MRIGILAVQGDYEAHARMLDRLGVPYRFVRTPRRLRGVDAMILPGGESTTMLKFLQEEGLEQPLRDLRDARRRIFRHVRGRDSAGARSARSGASIAGLRRSGDSRATPTGGNLPAKCAALHRSSRPSRWRWSSFARRSSRPSGPDVEVLASEDGRPVLVRQGRMLVATFHPELTDDTTVHEYFVKMANEAVDGEVAARRVTRTMPG